MLSREENSGVAISVICFLSLASHRKYFLKWDGEWIIFYFTALWFDKYKNNAANVGR